MSNLINLSFENQSVTTAIDGNGEIFFHATELATALGFGNPRQAIASHVDKEDVQKLDTLTKGGKQRINFVNESGMYALIFGSTKEQAKRFKRWVTSEVLPSIRKTGSYNKNPLSTKSDRKGLVQAVNRLVNRYKVSYATAWKVVHEYMNVDSVEELTLEQVQTATAYVHLILLDDTKEHQQALYKVLAGCASHLYDYMQIIKMLNRLPIACDTLGHNTFKAVLNDYTKIIEISLTLDLRNQYDKPMFEPGKINCYHGASITTNQLLTL